jgi:hypothetical protein
MTSDLAAPNHRLTELEDEIERQSRALRGSRMVDPDRIDAVRRLRILTNALELIRTRPK